MKIIQESLLSDVFEILKDADNRNIGIHKVRYTPEGNSIIVDMNYGKAIKIDVDNNNLVISGDTMYGELLKKIINKSL